MVPTPPPPKERASRLHPRLDKDPQTTLTSLSSGPDVLRSDGLSLVLSPSSSSWSDHGDGGVDVRKSRRHPRHRGSSYHDLRGVGRTDPTGGSDKDEGRPRRKERRHGPAPPTGTGRSDREGLTKGKGGFGGGETLVWSDTTSVAVGKGRPPLWTRDSERAGTEVLGVVVKRLKLKERKSPGQGRGEWGDPGKRVDVGRCQVGEVRETGGGSRAETTGGRDSRARLRVGRRRRRRRGQTREE